MIVQTGLGVQGERGGIAMSKCLLATFPVFCWHLDQGLLRATLTDRAPRERE